MNQIVYISDSRVRQLLNWNATYDVVEQALLSVANERAIQNARQITKVGPTNSLLYSMPGYLNDEKFGGLACKLVTDFPNKSNSLPSVMANIIYMDDKTGELKAIIAGTEITSWRTAAASAVATKYLKKGSKCTKSHKLSILGAGTQGKYHALAFRHFFTFGEIRIWNRTPERAQALVTELNSLDKKEKVFTYCETVEECVRDADIIVTATSGVTPVVKLEWLKQGVHINAVGVGPNLELDDNTYKASRVFIDNWDGAKSELGNLHNIGVKFEGQIGDVIAGKLPVPNLEDFTIFQSLGMAVEDCAMARLIYDFNVNTN